ncbi:S1 family peptidase [Streptomyces sp. NPDC087908]|uniref:S1 family peptidase n=1 Tax=Streptomyces sp. NPDC087908 TaxID=3365820 RepID=UPI00381C6904
MAKALASESGITVAQAKATIATQQKSLDVADKITKQLGERASGSWLDGKTGVLHINVRDDASAASASASGAVPHVVGNAVDTLDTLKSKLDKVAASGAPSGVHSWYVDAKTRKLVITAAPGAAGLSKGGFADLVRSAGDRVQVREEAGSLKDAAENVYAGQEIYNSSGKICSTGFNVQSLAGVQFTLTAGHCMQGNTNSTWHKNGLVFGTNTTYTYVNQDHAIIWNGAPLYWLPRAGVWRYDGMIHKVTGWQNSVQGTYVCKSGRTTGLTCGHVQAVNVSASTPSGPKTGQVQTNLCVEPGDSGGPVTAGTRALGLTGSSVTYGASNRCGQKVGRQNAALYQPIGPVLTSYGVNLVVTN